VIAALRGDVYVEIEPGELKAEREIALARVIFTHVH
jgi:hypothetical protein